MSDTWSDLVALKSKQSSLREKIARRKIEREIIGETLQPEDTKPDLSGIDSSSTSQSLSPAPSVKQEIKQEIKTEKVKIDPTVLKEIEKQVLLTLDDATIELPIDTEELFKLVTKNGPVEGISVSVVDDLVQKFSALMLLVSTIKVETSGNSSTIIESVDHAKITAVRDSYGDRSKQTDRKRKLDEDDDVHDKVLAKHPKREDLKKKDDVIESLLSTKSAKEMETTKINEEIMELLSKPSAKELSLVEKFRSQGGTSLKEFCPHGTRQECIKVQKKTCGKLHFKKILHKHTDESLGDCSFLNTCFHMDTCKYVHYEVDYADTIERPLGDKSVAKPATSSGSVTTLYPPQWVQCDMRCFDMKVLGKFAVIMADPPWDIHMELPYGTMSDEEMRKLGVPVLQDDGYIFLWVTGRAMELGRECLKLWGYERVDELIWVKTNQLQRIIRTGRTGHWFNHGKEHCLVGVKGNPKGMNRGLDCDVIVAEVRATSHKPDEVYGIIERLAPGTRKIELFGRPHNVQPNWITLGNQADGVKLVDPDVVKAFNAKYPNPKMALLSEEKGRQYFLTGTID